MSCKWAESWALFCEALLGLIAANHRRLISILPKCKNPKGITWYLGVAVGPIHCQTVKRLCETANITGFKTNHSLSVINATMPFQSGAEEQVTMERIEHCTDGVHIVLHKCTSGEQHCLMYYKRIHSGWDAKEAKVWLECTNWATFISSDSITIAILAVNGSLFNDWNKIISNLGPGTNVADSQLYS